MDTRKIKRSDKLDFTCKSYGASANTQIKIELSKSDYIFGYLFNVLTPPLSALKQTTINKFLLVYNFSNQQMQLIPHG